MKNLYKVFLISAILYVSYSPNILSQASSWTNCESQILPKTANVMATAHAPYEKDCSISGTLIADQYEKVMMLGSVDSRLIEGIGIAYVLITVSDENGVTKSLNVGITNGFQYETDLAFTCTKSSGCTYDFTIDAYAGGQSGSGTSLTISANPAWAQGVVWVQP